MNWPSVIEAVTFFFFYEFPRHPAPMRFPFPEKRWFLEFWLCNQTTAFDRIRCILISFHIPTEARPFFPHLVHPVMLRRHHPLERFRVEWYHFMDVTNHRRIMSVEQQRNDYRAIEDWIIQSPILSTTLAAQILYPQFEYATT